MMIDVHKYTEHIAQQHFGRGRYTIEPFQSRAMEVDFRSDVFDNKDMQKIYVGHVSWQPGFNTYIKALIDGDLIQKKYVWGPVPRLSSDSTDVNYPHYLTNFLWFKGLLCSYAGYSAADTPGERTHHWYFIGYVIKPQ